MISTFLKFFILFPAHFLPFIILGFYIDKVLGQVVEFHSIYDAIDKSTIDPTQLADCTIGLEYNANKTCILEFEAPEDMEPPIMIYYELNNFHQNHRFYSRSRDEFQLAGRVTDRDPTYEAMCEPLVKLGSKTLNPCGVTANSFFNDKIDLISGIDDQGNDLYMNEQGIAWQSDLEYKFKMPDGFRMTECPMEDCSTDGNATNCCDDLEFSCDAPVISKEDGLCYAFDYPEANTTQYLYQTYPDIISPLEHVTNEHFVVWMRIATRPRFRKLYGWIDQKIPKGQTFSFQISANFVVESFKGHKALIITTTSLFGGKNQMLGLTFYCLGFIFLFFGVFIAIKHWFKPRTIASRKYLYYKEE